MADPDKTFDPTSRRLEKAREEGNVPQSMEMTSAITLIVLALTTVLLAPFFVAWAKKEVIEGLSCRAELLSNSQVFVAWFNGKILGSLLIASPFFLAMALFGVAGHIFISGWNVSPKSLAWKTDELNPVKELQKLFSPQSLVKLFLSVVQLIFIGWIVFLYLRDKIEFLATLQWVAIDQVLPAIGGVVFGAVIRICIGLLIIGVIDWLYHKWKYIQNLKMTRQEVKEENRDTEGAPEIKRHLRKKQYEIGMRRMLKKVPQASVVLVNPTHVAVALYYQSGQTASPVVVAKGADHMCEKIKEIARSYGVPIIRRPALAREIYGTVKLDQPIPENLFTAVAEVLAVIFRLRNANKK